MNTAFCVYCHTNLQNGKRYIGITKQDPERRWRNGDGYKKGAFHNAIMKYGWGGFRHEVLFSGLTEAEAKAKEKELIRLYRTRNKDCGYNCTDGGDGTRGYERSEAERLAMSISRKGRHSGSKNPMYGRRSTSAPHYGEPMSDEAKAAASVKIKAAHENGAYDGLFRRVIGTAGDEVLEFDSVSQAAKAVGVPATNISRACRGKRKTAAGYTWAYA